MRFQRSVLFLLLALAGLPAAQAQQVPAPAPSNAIQLRFLGRYQTDIFDESAAEIVAHGPQTQRLFVVKATAAAVDVLDIRNPRVPTFVQYTNSRNFVGDPATDTAGDLGPEGLTFIPATESPNGRALLVVAHEVSGSTAVYQVDARYAYLPLITKE